MKYLDLERSAPSPVFTRQDLLLMGLKVYDHQLSQWVRKGYLVRLKNGIYAFGREMEQLQAEHVAFLLYQPSYLVSVRKFHLPVFILFLCILWQ